MPNKVAVFMEQEDKTLKGINVYENGFLDGVGRLLIENYNDKSSVQRLIDMKTPFLTLGNNLENVVELEEVLSEVVEDYNEFIVNTHVNPRAYLDIIQQYGGEEVTVVLGNDEVEELYAESSSDVIDGHYFENVCADGNLPIQRVADLSKNMPMIYVYSKSEVWLIFKYNELTQRYENVDILSMLLMDNKVIAKH